MKISKKLVSVLLVLTMLLALSVSVFAADNNTITITNSVSGHTYEAYQIFSGTLSDKGVLSNITWGSGVDGVKLLTALQSDKTTGLDFSKCTDAASVAKVLSDANLGENADATDAFAQIVGQHLSTASGTSTYSETDKDYAISNLADGYYLVKDKNGTITGSDTYTRFILQVVNDVSVAPKNTTTPTVEKKVKDINDSTETALSDWQDSADHDVGDTVPFQLTGTLPADLDKYTTYKFIFHDTESAGLTFNPSSVAVKVGDTTITSGYTVITTGLTDGCTFEVQFTDVKSISGVKAGSQITVEYTATLNKDAVLGSDGNPNTVYLEFSNDSNHSGSGDTNNTGKTPKDTVIVFTYKTVVNKVDASKKALTGAEFKLEKLYKGANGAADSWKEITVAKNTEGTTFTFSGLDDGIYKLTETTTPAGYNSIDPIYFTVTAEHDVTSDNPTLTKLSATQTAADGTALTTGTIATFTTTLTKTDSSVSTDIVNNAGSTLPSTGGIGTTLFYVIGVLLMSGAAVLLVTKKKMANREN
jgi:fimbrial isopeptide formation D2 family protein/LPXTG-motif cell wall-anchored protein